MRLQSIVLASAVVITATLSHAAELRVPAPPSGGAHLTIYTGDFALVRDQRAIRMPEATTDLAFTGVSGRMQPETALLETLKNPSLSISEQTFSFNTISLERLLERSIGKDVDVIATNPATGEQITKRARVLAVANGLVLEIDGKIHTSAPGRIVFDQLPKGLRSSPTLLMTANGEAGRTYDVELSYLTSGLSWKADYVAQYDPEAGRMDLKAWATITNTSGIDFDEAHIKLVAGNVNRVAPLPSPRVMRAMDMQMETASASVSQGVAQESLISYQMYGMPGTSTLNDRESKQLALLDGRGIVVARELVSRGQPYRFTSPLRGQSQDANAEVHLKFANTDTTNLGVPLPAGIVRVYGNDSDGAPQFLGEGNLNHTAVGRDVSVRLGADFDVSVKREQSNFVRLAENVTSTSWRVVISNAKARAVDVRVIEQIPGSWEITTETDPHEKLTAASAEWTMTVPAQNDITLEFTVRTRF